MNWDLDELHAEISAEFGRFAECYAPTRAELRIESGDGFKNIERLGYVPKDTHVCSGCTLLIPAGRIYCADSCKWLHLNSLPPPPAGCCGSCQSPLPDVSSRGRPRLWCSDMCRKRGERNKRTLSRSMNETKK